MRNKQGLLPITGLQALFVLALCGISTHSNRITIFSYYVVSKWMCDTYDLVMSPNRSINNRVLRR